MASTITRLFGISALLLAAAPAQAMDDEVIWWRFDGRAEKRISSVAPATEWAASAWIGEDRNKLRLANTGIVGDNGHIDNEGGTRGIDTRFFYSRLISDFWDAKAGVQFTVFDEGVTRSGFLAGVEGVAPFGVHVDLVAGVSQTGVVSARLEASYDALLSQKLIATPYLEAMVASKDDPAIQLGSGLARVELGLRLRYEITKEVAPYIGVAFEQFTGNTAGFVAASGEPTSLVRALVGLKVWF
ncbi:copper resistance protein B [Reyranella sp.]|uniref:copper resistance protein B n=1 Tax=Reyranella sp. TaxID=1929291 RepID=UPI003D1430FC